MATSKTTTTCSYSKRAQQAYIQPFNRAHATRCSILLHAELFCDVILPFRGRARACTVASPHACVQGRYGWGCAAFLMLHPRLCFKQLKFGSYYKEYIKLHDAASVTQAITLTTIFRYECSWRIGANGAAAPPSLASLIACGAGHAEWKAQDL